MFSLLKYNAKIIWEKFTGFSFFDTTNRTILLTNSSDSEGLIEQVENGKIILIIKTCSSNFYTLAFADKNGEYKQRSIWEPEIIKALNQYALPSGDNSMPLKENNDESAFLFKSINVLLKEDKSKYLITDNSRYAGILSIVNMFTKAIPFIFIPVIVGIKTLIDWGTRKPFSYDKIEAAVANIDAMNNDEIEEFSRRVRWGYKPSYTTSTSSQKMIKQMQGLNTPQPKDKKNIINYVENTHNNGKKLFCKVIETAVNDIDYIKSAPERQQERIEELQRRNQYQNMTNDELSASLIKCFALLKRHSQKFFITTIEVSYRDVLQSDVEFLLSLHKDRGIKAPHGLYVNQGKIVEPDDNGRHSSYRLATGNFY